MNNQRAFFAPIGGRLLDLYRLATFKLLNPHSLTKAGLIRSIQRQHRASVFIESGTYLGVTTRRLRADFARIYTFEIDEELAMQASVLLEPFANISVINNDALVGIESVLEAGGFGETFIIFLDGHVTHGPCNPDHPEPAILELEVAAKFKDHIEAIIIDDFRNFGVQAGFPAKSELFAAYEYLFGEHQFSISVVHDLVVIRKRCH